MQSGKAKGSGELNRWQSDFLQRFADTNLRGDLFGGVTTAIISLPLALTFGVASGAGPAAGLYGAVLVGFFAALFGGTRTLISEPTGPMTVIMTAVVTHVIASDPENGLATAFAVVVVAGLTQIVFGVLRLGRFITLMPYSVISGFMSGIGILLILLQLGPLLGQDAPEGGAIGVLRGLPQLIAGIEAREVLLSAVALAFLLGMPRRWRHHVPPHLLALVGGSLVALVFFQDDALRRIGDIPMGLPEFRWPHFGAAHASTILVDGMILGMLGCIDTLLTAMIADSLTRQQHQSNRELVGQGVANVVSGLFGGLPGAGATMGTVVNIQVGARSPLAAILRSLLLLLVILAIAPLLSGIPLAVLAAIAVKVGIDILDWSFLKRAHRVSRSATTIMYGVMALTVFVDLIVAVGLGVFIANILTIERLSRIQSESIHPIDSSGQDLPLSEAEQALFDKGQGRILLLHLTGPMIFGVAKAIAREHAEFSRAGALVIDVSTVPLMSTTVALALENMIRDARSAGLPVCVCATGQTRVRLERIEKTSHKGVLFRETRLDGLEAVLEAMDPPGERERVSSHSTSG